MPKKRAKKKILLANNEDSDEDSDTDEATSYRQRGRRRGRHCSLCFHSPDRSSDSENEVPFPGSQPRLGPHCSRCLHPSSESEDESDSEALHPLLPPPPPPPPWQTTGAFMAGASGANTISHSTMNAVDGSQTIVNNSVHNNYALIHIGDVNININVGEADVWVVSVGLFGQGDAMNMRCT